MKTGPSIRGVEPCTVCKGTKWCMRSTPQPVKGARVFKAWTMKCRTPRSKCMDGRKNYTPRAEALLLLVMHAEGKPVNLDRLKLAAQHIRASIVQEGED